VVKYFNFGRINNVAGSGGISQKKNIFRQYRYKRHQEPVFSGFSCSARVQKHRFSGGCYIFLASAVYRKWRIRATFFREGNIFRKYRYNMLRCNGVKILLIAASLD
jgi:hypothetical protein